MVQYQFSLLKTKYTKTARAETFLDFQTIIKLFKQLNYLNLLCNLNFLCLINLLTEALKK